MDEVIVKTEKHQISVECEGQQATFALEDFTESKPLIRTDIEVSDPADEWKIFYFYQEEARLTIVCSRRERIWVGYGPASAIFQKIVKVSAFTSGIVLDEKGLSLQVMGYIYNPLGIDLGTAHICLGTLSSPAVNLPVSRKKIRRRKLIFSQPFPVSFSMEDLLKEDFLGGLRIIVSLDVHSVQAVYPVGYGTIKKRAGWKRYAPQQLLKLQGYVLYLTRTKKGNLALVKYLQSELTEQQEEKLKRNTFGQRVLFTLRGIKRRVSKVLTRFCRDEYHVFYKWIPTDPKMALFLSFHGRGYSDNPRAIYEEMRNDPRFKDFKFIWAIKDHKKKNLDIPGAKVIEYYSVPYFWYLARAKYWIFNCKMAEYIRKKDNQVYLQTWHGTPLKKLGHDIDINEDATFYRSGMSYEEMCRSYDVDSARYDWMISPNAFCTEVFPGAFGVPKEKLAEIGYPRNDFMSNFTQEDVKRVKEKYNIPEDKKVLLYAPTWRDNSFVSSGYTFELQADFKKWKEILGDDWVVLFKPHYLIINTQEDDPDLEGFLIDIPANDDIRDLYIVADEMVTDYSSVFFDYGILERPVYFYMYDLEDYASNLRGFYMDITKELPGPIFKDEEAMLKAIAKGNFDFAPYKRFNARYNNMEDGKAAKRAVELLASKLPENTK